MRKSLSILAEILNSGCSYLSATIHGQHFTKFWPPNPSQVDNCGHLTYYLTYYIPFFHVTKRHRLSKDHPPTSSCLSSNWMTPYPGSIFLVWNWHQNLQSENLQHKLCIVKNGLDEEHPRGTSVQTSSWTSKTDTNSEALIKYYFRMILQKSFQPIVQCLIFPTLSLSAIPPFLDSTFMMTCWKCVLELEMAL